MIAERLVAFSDTRQFPQSAFDVLQLSLLDWCAVAIAGRDEPVANILRDQALEEGGAAQASMIGAATRVPARAAALVNGATGHAIDYDDTHFAHIGHPTTAVLPAALALAQHCDATGQSLREATLIGVEASIRVGVWLGRSHYQIGYHQTATAGAFGACLAACRLLGLSPQQSMMALGIVSTRASGLKSQFGTMGKPMNAGIAAANGVEAALLAQRGFISRGEAVDGAVGFGPTHQGEANDEAWEGIGQTWWFERVSHKLHACCHGLHAMLEAISPLEGTADRIAQVEVRTHPGWLSVCNIQAPQTGLEAKFSYRFTAAMRILGHDTGVPSSFTDGLCGEAGLLALRDKVTVSACDRLGEMQVRVNVRQRDGAERVFTHDLDVRLPAETRQKRVRAKAVALIGEEKANRLWELIATGGSAAFLAEELCR